MRTVINGLALGSNQHFVQTVITPGMIPSSFFSPLLPSLSPLMHTLFSLSLPQSLFSSVSPSLPVVIHGHRAGLRKKQVMCHCFCSSISKSFFSGQNCGN